MFYDQVKESADYISSKINAKADFAVILGSGLGKIVDIMENKEIDLITVCSVMQNVETESERSFRDTVIRERVKLYDVA